MDNVINITLESILSKCKDLDLSDVVLENDPTLEKLFKKTEELQKDALKRKDINEKQLESDVVRL